MAHTTTREDLAMIAALQAKGFICARFKPSGEAMPHEEIECAVNLLRSLRAVKPEWRAVRVDGSLNWNIVEPRSQDAIVDACASEPTQ